jgi:hypothetical protein
VRVLDPRRRWRVARTRTGPAADARPASPCRQGRVADPDALSVAVRRARTSGRPPQVAVQTVTLSRTPHAAAAAYRSVVGWYAACRAPRLQLVGAHVVDGVGDRAELLTFRRWREVDRSLSVAVARVGSVTTSVTARAATTPGAATTAARRAARVLSTAVLRLCPVAGTAAGCRHRPQLRPASLPPAGVGTGLLVAVDLPPVGRVDRPWIGTRPRWLHVDGATTRCDRVSLFAAGASRARTRTFLIPGAALPVRFGLTETYGVFATAGAAGRFATAVRHAVAGCERRDPATRVRRERVTARRRPPERSAWHLTTQVSPERSVRFRLGVVRAGRAVARLTFTPTPEGDMGAAAFDALLRRAGDRLHELAAAGRGAK